MMKIVIIVLTIVLIIGDNSSKYFSQASGLVAEVELHYRIDPTQLVEQGMVLQCLAASVAPPQVKGLGFRVEETR